MIRAESREKYQVEIGARGHRWQSDEPLASGGDDTGPSPYELLLGALAACKIITVRMYAERKGWPLEGIRASLSRRMVPAGELGDGDPDADGMVDLLEVEMRFDGDLEPEQRARLLEISERCPVHRTLTGEIRIHSNRKVAETAFGHV